MLFFGTKKDGVVRWNNQKAIDAHLKSLPDCRIQMDLKRHRAKRSDQQNALYWVWLHFISESTGYHPDELHTTFRSLFLTDRSKKLPLVRSTTVLTTLEFMIYLNRIEQEANRLGIVLPNPLDYWDEKTQEAYGAGKKVVDKGL